MAEPQTYIEESNYLTSEPRTYKQVVAHLKRYGGKIITPEVDFGLNSKCQFKCPYVTLTGAMVMALEQDVINILVIHA